MSAKLHTCHMQFLYREKGPYRLRYGFLNIKSGLLSCWMMLLCLFVKAMVRFVWRAWERDYILLQLLIQR